MDDEKMNIYYQDEKMTIKEHDGLYDVYDKKWKNGIKTLNTTKEMADIFIKSRCIAIAARTKRIKRNQKRNDSVWQS